MRSPYDHSNKTQTITSNLLQRSHATNSLFQTIAVNIIFTQDKNNQTKSKPQNIHIFTHPSSSYPATKSLEPPITRSHYFNKNNINKPTQKMTIHLDEPHDDHDPIQNDIHIPIINYQTIRPKTDKRDDKSVIKLTDDPVTSKDIQAKIKLSSGFSKLSKGIEHPQSIVKSDNVHLILEGGHLRICDRGSNITTINIEEVSSFNWTKDSSTLGMLYWIYVEDSEKDYYLVSKDASHFNFFIRNVRQSINNSLVYEEQLKLIYLIF